MAIRLLESFGHYSRQNGSIPSFRTQFPMKWTTRSGARTNWNLVEGTPTGSGWMMTAGLLPSATDQDRHKINRGFSETDELILGFRVYHQFISENQSFLRFLRRGANLEFGSGVSCFLQQTTNGELLFGPAEGGGIGTGLFCAAQEYNYVEIHCKLDNPPHGTLRILLNGGELFEQSNVQFFDSASHRFAVFQFVNGSTHGLRVGDLYFNDLGNDPDPVYPDFLGDIRIIPVFPEADDEVDFTPSEGTDNFEMVNDKPVPGEPGHGPDEDATTNTSNTPGARDLFFGPSVVPEGYKIFAVQGTNRTRKEDSGPSAMRHVMRHNGVVGVGPIFFNTTGYRYRVSVFERSPFTDGEWTAAEVNNMSFGYEIPPENE